MAGINGFGPHNNNILNMMQGKSKNAAGTTASKKNNLSFNASFQITSSSLVKAFSPDNRSYSVVRYDNASFSGLGAMMPIPAYSRSTNANPDTIFLSKSQPAMSEEEFMQAIINLAKEERAKGVQWGCSDKFKALSEQYISVASPDRTGISRESGFSIPSGATHLVAKMVDDETGEVIGQYQGGSGWSIRYTQAEFDRMRSYDTIYYEAYWGKSAGDSTTGANSGGTTTEISESSNIDVKA